MEGSRAGDGPRPLRAQQVNGGAIEPAARMLFETAKLARRVTSHHIKYSFFD
jgi:hypothetical protein